MVYKRHIEISEKELTPAPGDGVAATPVGVGLSSWTAIVVRGAAARARNAVSLQSLVADVSARGKDSSVCLRVHSEFLVGKALSDRPPAGGLGRDKTQLVVPGESGGDEEGGGEDEEEKERESRMRHCLFFCYFFPLLLVFFSLESLSVSLPVSVYICGLCCVGIRIGVMGCVWKRRRRGMEK